MKRNNKAARAPGQPVIRPALRLLARNVLEHNVTKNAAALAYYFLFAIFPLLIFLSNLLGMLDLNVLAITQVLGRFLPGDIMNLVESYLEHISQNSGHVLLWFSLVFSVWFPMRAVKGLMDDIRLAHHLRRPPDSVAYRLRQLAFTIIFLVVIVLTLVLSTLGKHVLHSISRLLPGSLLHLPDRLLSLWQFLRFVPVALLMLAVLSALYTAALDSRPPIKTILPGIIAALFSWMLVSIGFSFYVENFAHYSLIYGTMGAMIVLMMWLYMSSVILILGAELNAALIDAKAAAAPPS